MAQEWNLIANSFVRLTQQQWIDELNLIFGDKIHQWPVLIKGMVNSIVMVVHFKTNFMKIVQNYFSNWYCKILIWPIMKSRHPWALVGSAYIEYCANTWLLKKFVWVVSHTNCQSLKTNRYRRIIWNILEDNGVIFND